MQWVPNLEVRWYKQTEACVTRSLYAAKDSSALILNSFEFFFLNYKIKQIRGSFVKTYRSMRSMSTIEPQTRGSTGKRIVWFEVKNIIKILFEALLTSEQSPLIYTIKICKRLSVPGDPLRNLEIRDQNGSRSTWKIKGSRYFYFQKKSDRNLSRY